MRLVLFVILFFGYTFDSYSQNVVNYCKGEVRNFAVPYTNGSVYNWYLENPNLATILSGNGTEHVTLNLSNSGIVHLTV